MHPRSGLAARCGLSIVNTPGTVDAGYRGEIKVLLINLDPARPVELARGDRIAQLVLGKGGGAAAKRKVLVCAADAGIEKRVLAALGARGLEATASRMGCDAAAADDGAD